MNEESLDAPNLIKCHCQTCNERIEFEAEHAGETIPCPHCGIDTTLYATFVPPPPVLKPRRNLSKSLIILCLIVAGIGIVGSGTVFKLYHYRIVGSGHARKVSQQPGQAVAKGDEWPWAKKSEIAKQKVTGAFGYLLGERPSGDLKFDAAPEKDGTRYCMVDLPLGDPSGFHDLTLDVTEDGRLYRITAMGWSGDNYRDYSKTFQKTLEDKYGLLRGDDEYFTYGDTNRSVSLMLSKKAEMILLYYIANDLEKPILEKRRQKEDEAKKLAASKL